MKMTMKILGTRFTLEPRDISDEPATRTQQIGYVGFPGTNQLKVARWLNGQWVTEKGQPFSVPPSCWYSLELPNG